MNEDYQIKKNIEKILNNIPTGFLNGKMQKEIKKRIPNKYNIYYPYIDSEKVIFYQKKLPKITLFQIETNQQLKHQDILGTIFSLGLNEETFGDIIVDEKYYIYVLESIKDYLKIYFTNIKNINISLKQIDLERMQNYKRKYIKKEITVTSQRIDVVIKAIVNISRKEIQEKIKNKEIYLNYEILKTPSKTLKKGDIFSIRKHGKYIYDGFIKKTKKGKIIIRYFKYI